MKIALDSAPVRDYKEGTVKLFIHLFIILFMKKIIFENGLTFICNETNVNDKELSLTFRCGHINEPKLGLAALYEHIVQQQLAKNLGSVCGGSLTSFFLPLDDIVTGVKSLYNWTVAKKLNDKHVQQAANDIVEHTRDLAPLPLRQTKLAYKHTAYGKDNVVWNTEEYINAVSLLTTDDVKAYIAENLVGNNMVVVFSGSPMLFETAENEVRKYFGELPAGTHKEIGISYTGGFQQLAGNGTVQLAMFGWDISRFGSTAELNVLMSMLSSRLERQLSKVKAEVEVKIAGYFGLRTLRVRVSSASRKNFNECLDIVCANIKRLQTSNASERRLETSRQKAMAERLAISNEALPRSVEIAWSLLGRDVDYNNDECISQTWRVSADDVKYAAQDIFSEKLTCVLYTNLRTTRSYDALVAAMK